MAKNKITEGMVIPRHIGIIMDGNGRWAKKRLLPRTAGHKVGLDAFVNTVDNCSALQSVVLGDRLRKIGANAFYDCADLSEIVIPQSVEAIGKRAFVGCTKLTIYAPENSYAELYALENDIRFQAI